MNGAIILPILTMCFLSVHFCKRITNTMLVFIRLYKIYRIFVTPTADGKTILTDCQFTFLFTFKVDNHVISLASEIQNQTKSHIWILKSDYLFNSWQHLTDFGGGHREIFTPIFGLVSTTLLNTSWLKTRKPISRMFWTRFSSFSGELRFYLIFF